MTTMPPMKTRRQDGSDSDLEPIEPFQSDIWFEDGNIILQAENTQFRVYKGTLRSSSEVLKIAIDNMEDSKGLDGCPVLYLHDSPVDLGFVLRNIFYRWSYPDNAPWPFGVVAAFLRLGRKYELHAAYDSARARLTTVFPSSLETYTTATCTKHIACTTRKDIVRDTIVLCRELDLLEPVPIAFWYFSMCGMQSPGIGMGRIPQVDQDMILEALTPLRTAHANYLFQWLDKKIASPDCAKPDICPQTKLEYSVKLWKPPGIMPYFSWPKDAGKGLCSPCVALAKKHHSEGAKRLWKELPSFFGMPPWEELLTDAPKAPDA
ncbi:hypothetical protein C8R47DRAFT_1147835 [Mycena vitilis]|nr:hypothetical protein C8R47DRAFT_1147835 [Mycena vitilis]